MLPSSSDPIQFINRYSGQIETEVIYGEKWLRWAYANPLGLLGTRLLFSRAFFSNAYGRRMNRAESRQLIAPFIERYGIDMDECAEAIDSFAHFNAFFQRHLKPTARPIDERSDAVVFPADGRHLLFQRFQSHQGLLVKGQTFALKDLLMPVLSADEADCFAEGDLVISRLCPVDYHRFHFPVDGRVERMQTCGNRYYSVSPIALKQNIRYLLENKRTITQLVDTPAGKVIYIEVGATCVGSIIQTFGGVGQGIKKGQEKGCFAFGGSTVITVFEPGRVRFSEDLKSASAKGIELYARVGDFMASC
jgi:phosphatidylserine decarboxylase